MTTIMNPYLNFRGAARDAMAFYQAALGGELTVSSFKDFGAEVAADEEDLVMHSQLSTPAGFLLMGADVPSHMDYTRGVNDGSVSLSGDDEAQLTGYWQKLSEGATVLQPLTKAPWGDSFGMLADKFGTVWLVNISAPAAA
ncbi:MAG TPA: VOC family protein [Pseudolysinimonas sp.]|jgi:PhnB protein